MIAYFEITVLDGGARGSIMIGLSDIDVPLNRHPGWEDNSFGYCGEDGKKYSEGPRGESYSEAFSTGDTVGCGIHYNKHEIFFTKNGKFLGVAFKKVKGINLYATVGLHSIGESVVANFGATPFKFDIDSMIQEERDSIKEDINSYNLSLIDLNQLLKNYFLYYGYQDTFESFSATSTNSSSTSTSKKDTILDSLKDRKLIRKAIIGGECQYAIDLTAKLYPNLFTLYPNSLFVLQCQLFIEYLLINKIEDALIYAKQIFNSKRRKELTSIQLIYLESILGLLAYPDPNTSTLSYLLKMEQREKVADDINDSILNYISNESSSSSSSSETSTKTTLEKLLKQLMLTSKTLKEENGGYGFDINNNFMFND